MKLTSYKTRLANITNVYNVVGISLYLGVVDPAKGIEDYKTKLEKAGINDVAAGVQKQLG